MCSSSGVHAPTCRFMCSSSGADAPTCRFMRSSSGVHAPTCRFRCSSLSMHVPTCRFMCSSLGIHIAADFGEWARDPVLYSPVYVARELALRLILQASVPVLAHRHFSCYLVGVDFRCTYTDLDARVVRK